MSNKSIEGHFQFSSKDSHYIAIGMFTANLQSRAQLLSDSLKRFSISHHLHQVPHIHRGISSKGLIDSEFSKPNLIQAALNYHKLPVLYIDIDCVISSYPFLIDRLVSHGHELAIFNWFSSEQNDAYTALSKQGFDNHRYFGFSHSLPYFDDNQLRCSGAVQFWANTPKARELLIKWQSVIYANPFAADDYCLDFAFNNTATLQKPKHVWLPKSYARYAFWIFEKPVINHPDFPATIDAVIEPTQSNDEKIFYLERLKPKFSYNYLQQNEYLDIKENIILIIEGEKVTPLRKNTMQFWIN
jgi:hypothetical protein